jgi:hypothetical protein
MYVLAFQALRSFINYYTFESESLKRLEEVMHVYSTLPTFYVCCTKVLVSF